MKYIDIHSHLLYDVDDGSKDLETSIKYLNELKEMGMNKVVCTPHIRHGNTDKTLKVINNFKVLEEEAKKIGVKLYLGNEIMYSSKVIELLKDKKINTINDSKYVLVEFKRNENMDEDNALLFLESLIEEGYKPIIAHVELYKHYRNLDFVEKVRDLGVIVQIDSTSVLADIAPIEIYLYTHKLLNNKLVDVVSSDSHCTNKRNFKSMGRAYRVIRRKYGEGYANIIFHDNPLEIVGDLDEEI